MTGPGRGRGCGCPRLAVKWMLLCINALRILNAAFRRI